MSKKRQQNDLSSIRSRRKITKIENVTLNKEYMKQDFRENLSNAYHEKKSFKSENGAYALAEPFPCYVLPNFISSNQYLTKLQNELNELDMYKKENDLYHFSQSSDLNSISSPYIKMFRELLNKEVLNFMKEITHVPLIETVDLTCSLYRQSDYLLCHDDELEGRRIAFIFYLVPEWNHDCGGQLDLFSSANEQPTEISVSLLPMFNNFVFFEVSPYSFHQVSEVLLDKERLSVSGWFHGPTITNSVSLKTDSQLTMKEAKAFKGDIRSWINPSYLLPSVQIKIRQIFEVESELELQDFLNESKYFEVSEALFENGFQWDHQGPPNKRNFQSGIHLPEIVEECVQVLQSQEMCLILSNLTGLALHSMAEVESSADSDSTDGDSSNSTYHKENKSLKSPCMAAVSSLVRKWTHGCYTLLHDHGSKAGLDGILYFNCSDYSDDFGGSTSYIAKDDGCELLKVTPKLNSYALVYRDEKTASFVKYVNSKIFETKNPVFHDISISYLEKTEERH